ncbi:MAG: hypothetical protein ACK4UN_04860, partial [Limisphaerales bacterium]
MLVYGDPQFILQGAEVRQRLRAFAAQAKSPDVDSARQLLIYCGQLEQAISDLAEQKDKHQPAAREIEKLTDV